MPAAELGSDRFHGVSLTNVHFPKARAGEHVRSCVLRFPSRPDLGSQPEFAAASAGAAGDAARGFEPSRGLRVWCSSLPCSRA